MAHPIVTTLTMTAPNNQGITTPAALPGANGLSTVLNGTLVVAGVAVLDVPRRIAILSGGNDSGITFRVTGTARPEMGGVVFSETITGGNGVSVATTQDFATVTSVTASGSSAGVVRVGTADLASGPWVAWDMNKTPFQVSFFGAVVSGTPIYQVDYTYDDVFGLWLPANVLFPRPVTLVTAQNLSGTADGSFNFPIRASRLTLTFRGGAQLTQQQSRG